MPILSVPAGRDYGLYFYGHRGTNNVDFCTTPTNVCTRTPIGLTLSAAYTVIGGGVISYTQNVGFPFFRNLQPLSSYILRVRETMNIPVVGDSVAPTTYNIVPGLNTLYIDTNAITFPISSFCNGSNTRIVYGTYDGSDETPLGLPAQGIPYFTYGVRTNFNTSNSQGLGIGSIAYFRPGSAYVVDATTSFAITYQRRSQYIITDSGTPNYPGYIITTNSGDRLTTGQQG